MNDQSNNTRRITRSHNVSLFDSLVWVNLATNPEEIRSFCHYLHVTQYGEIIATDGARMHRVTPPLEQVGEWGLEPGVYILHRHNADSISLQPVVGVEGSKSHQLPVNVSDLFQLPEKCPAPINWKKSDFNQVTPADLYRLIVALGVERNPNDSDIGFNPDYLVDMVGKASEKVYRTEPNTIIARSAIREQNVKNAEGETVEVLRFPAYDAVLMGIML